MTTEPVRIYWDSCVYISCIQETADRIATLRRLVQAAKDGEIVFVASAMVIAEVVKIDKDSPATFADQAKKIREFFENDYIKVREVDRRTAEDAQAISRKFGLKPPDAIHVATALRWKCRSLQTYDGEKGEAKKLLAFDGLIGVPALKIELPSYVAKPVQHQLLG